MEREVLSFTSENKWLKDRALDLTSSEIGTLFGVGWISYEELVLNKKNRILKPIEENERMRWGKALEKSIAEEFARQNGWTIRRKNEYIRIPEFRIGSSFDYEISHEDMNSSESGNELLEIKNVDSFQYKKDWAKGFDIEAPAKIELQIQNELLVSGLEVGYLCILIGGNQGLCLRREANKKVHEAIIKKAERFWKEVGK